MKVCTREQLPEVFKEIENSSIMGLPGVKMITQGNPTKMLVISAMTHPGEDSGLFAFDCILRHQDSLKDVCLFLLIGNLDGARAYINDGMPDKRDKYSRMGGNMNRVPAGNPMHWRSLPTSHERARDLQKLVKDTRFQGALDIHSTPQPLDGGIVLDIAGTEHELASMTSVIPVKHRLRNITTVQLSNGSGTQPFATVFNCPAIEVETGQHATEEGRRTAVQTAFAFLHSFGALQEDTAATVELKPRYEYRVDGTVMVPHHRYKVSGKQFLENFVYVPEGTVIMEAMDAEEKIVMPQSGHLVFTWGDRVLKGLTPGDEHYELFFRTGLRTEITQRIFACHVEL